jgi:membrane protease YdiL (CAAX protease family)
MEPLTNGNRFAIWETEEKPLSKKLYVLGLGVIFVSIYSQYLFETLHPVVRVLLVYGVPLVVTGLIWGRPIMQRALKNTPTALKYGMGFFGAFIVLGTLLASVILLVILVYDPNAINILNTPNPLLQISPEYAWIMVLASILVVGPVEEYLFTGFVYGGLLNIFKRGNWFVLAIISSVLFAVVHFYYAIVYGLASLVLFVMLMTFNLAMTSTYRFSKGNLVVPIVIHGLYDATGFLGAAISVNITLILRGSMILIGLIVAAIVFIQRLRRGGVERSQKYPVVVEIA